MLATTSKTDIHIAFNSYHTPFFDAFFFYVTYLGDGIMALLVALMLLAVKYRYALVVGISNIVASLTTQVLKQTLFADELRPKKYFENLHDLYFVPGVDNHLYHSFPSGHATCAFALYFSLALLVKNKMYKMLFFIIALLTGFSRVYISQHFFADIYVGSLIGVGISLIVYFIINNKQQAWLDRSLITSMKLNE